MREMSARTIELGIPFIDYKRVTPKMITKEKMLVGYYIVERINKRNEVKEPTILRRKES